MQLERSEIQLDAQLRSFLLAIALHPGVQKKAQEELDRVVGRDSLPSCADLPNLSYINALCSETLRWHPATPIGLPHKLKQDDVVNGYFIPKGTICIGNSWFLLRSERDYGSNTNEFRPERFLDGSAKLNPDAAFGYGRRYGYAFYYSVTTLIKPSTPRYTFLSVCVQAKHWRKHSLALSLRQFYTLQIFPC